MIRVLLVEDNVADVELVREALSCCDLQHEMEVASDFEEARQFIEQIGVSETRPDVVLMDLNLPKGSGLDLLRMLRAKPGGHNVPVVVVSSSNAPSDRARAAEYNVKDYFRKPADIDEFMKLGPMVRSIVGKDGRHGSI